MDYILHNDIILIGFYHQRFTLLTIIQHLQVVDDNYVNRLVSTKMLRRYGVNVVTAESGQQAIDILKGAAHDIDIVFMDVQMPGMDGSVFSLHST